MTKYVVLRREGDDTAFVPFSGTFDGANGEAAIKAALLSGNGAGDPSGEYVAVPLRSWKPRKVEAKQAFSFS